MLTLEKAMDGELVKYNMSAEGTVFIVPNKASHAGEYLDIELESRYADEVCRLNGLDKFDPEKDLLTEMWFVSVEDLGTDNVSVNGIEITVGGERYWGRISEDLPSKLVKNWKEGEAVEVKLPVYLYTNRYDYEDWNRDPKDQAAGVYYNTVLNFKLTPDQLGNKFREFGDFQTVAESVNAE